MSNEQVDLTPRETIKTRLRTQVLDHLALYRPIEADLGELDAIMAITDRREQIARAHLAAQWADLGLSAARLVTVPSDPWQPGQDRDKTTYRRFRNVTQYNAAGTAGEAWQRLQVEGIDECQGVYVVPQVLKPEKLGLTTWDRKKIHGAVGDSDVAKVITTYIDIDAKKSADGMATDAEALEAFEVAADLYCDIVAVLGTERGLGFVFSGSGCQIWIHHEAQDPVWARQFRVKLLHSLAQLYARGYGKRIDTTVANAARLAPLAGSWKRKAKSDGRPHRSVAYWSAEPGHRISWDQFVGLVDHFHAQAPVPEGVWKTHEKRIARDDSDSIYKVANADDTQAIWNLLAGGEFVCPGCNGENAKPGEVHLSKYGGLYCERNRCSAKRHWTNLDIVCAHLGLDPASQVGEAYDWLASRRGLPTRETASEYDFVDEEGMSVSAEDDLEEVFATATEFKPHEKPSIRLGADTDRVLRETIQALAAHPDVYSLGSSLVTIRSGQTAPIDLSVLRLEYMAEAATFEVRDKKRWVPTKPPKEVAEAVSKRGHWRGIRAVTSITDIPMFMADGSVLQVPGYDPGSGVVYTPRLRIPEVPTNPSAAEIAEAQALLDEITCDAPIDTQSRGVYLSAILSAVARAAIDGPVPFHLFHGNTPGVGKELFISVLGEIAGGLNSTPYNGEKSELRKQITSRLMSARPIEAWDNIPTGGVFGNHVLHTLFTGAVWTDRSLGKNKQVVLPNTPVWCASGSNVELDSDMVRRSVIVRFLSAEERPEERKDFRHENLLAWVRENRGPIIHAALTLLRAYHVAGRPSMGVVSGSFSGWASLVGNCVAWLGYGDPVQTRKQIAASGGGAHEVVALLAAWLDTYEERQVGAADVLTGISGPELGDPLKNAIIALTESGRFKADRNGLPSSRSLGRLLSSVKDRVLTVGGRKVRMLATMDEHAGSLMYSVAGFSDEQTNPPETRKETRANYRYDSDNLEDSAGLRVSFPMFQTSGDGDYTPPRPVTGTASSSQMENSHARNPQTRQPEVTSRNNETNGGGFLSGEKPAEKKPAEHLPGQTLIRVRRLADGTCIAWVREDGQVTASTLPDDSLFRAHGLDVLTGQTLEVDIALSREAA